MSIVIRCESYVDAYLQCRITNNPSYLVLHRSGTEPIDLSFVLKINKVRSLHDHVYFCQTHVNYSLLCDIIIDYHVLGGLHSGLIHRVHCTTFKAICRSLY